MTLLSNDELRGFIETDITNDSMTIVANAAEKMIDREAGEVAAVTENFNEWGFPSGQNPRLYTARSITSITSITERDHPDDDALVLSADDYRIENERMIIRLQEGTNPRLLWAMMVEIVFVPDAQTEIRKRVQIDLVKLALTFTGAQREAKGDFEFWHFDQDEAVNNALRPLRNSHNRLPIA